MKASELLAVLAKTLGDGNDPDVDVTPGPSLVAPAAPAPAFLGQAATFEEGLAYLQADPPRNPDTGAPASFTAAESRHRYLLAVVQYAGAAIDPEVLEFTARIGDERLPLHEPGSFVPAAAYMGGLDGITPANFYADWIGRQHTGIAPPVPER